MNKKTVCSIAAGIVILLCCVLYFRPLSLSANITENNSLIVQIKEFVVRNEVPYIDSRDHDHIAEEQKRKITELMQGYSYKRTWKTSFSDGTIERIGNRAVFLYVYDHEAEVRSIYVSDSGQVSIDNKLYKMKNAEQFNAQVETILRSNYDLHLAEFGSPHNFIPPVPLSPRGPGPATTVPARRPLGAQRRRGTPRHSVRGSDLLREPGRPAAWSPLAARGPSGAKRRRRAPAEEMLPLPRLQPCPERRPPRSGPASPPQCVRSGMAPSRCFPTAASE